MKGYYSLVQYQPCPARAEGVNLGVIVVCCGREYLDSLFLGCPERRVRQAFPWVAESDEQLLDRIVGIQHRLRSVAPSGVALLGFAQTRCNEIVITKPRYVEIRTTPEHHLMDLFQRLVEPPTMET
jgi:hypothetical protein